MPPKPRDPGLLAAITAAGGIRPLARAIGISHPGVVRWTSVPLRHLLKVEKVTGVPREKLRPELYRRKPNP